MTKSLILPRIMGLLSLSFVVGIFQAGHAETLKPVTLKEASDLYLEGQNAEQRKLPILIMFSMEHCAYCEIVREEFLKPMLRNAAYDNKVIIREIHTDSYSSLRDFDGKEINVDDLTARYRASFSPTVVFVDHQGRPLAERMVGIATRDYYGGFLDDAIEQSLQQLRQLAYNQAKH